jgi:hypothetical protein
MSRDQRELWAWPVGANRSGLTTWGRVGIYSTRMETPGAWQEGGLAWVLGPSPYLLVSPHETRPPLSNQD